MTEDTWYTAEQIAEKMGLTASTVRTEARGRIERRLVTPTEKMLRGTNIQYVYRQAESVALTLVEEPVWEVVEEVSGPSLEGMDLRDIRIRWEDFSVEHNGVTYLSLRKMVEVGGLYSSMQKAKQALLASSEILKDATGVAGEVFNLRLKTSGHQGGRPREDFLLLPEVAKVFAARAGTEAGKNLCQVIVAHSNVYQAAHFHQDAEATMHILHGNKPAQIPVQDVDPLEVAAKILTSNTRLVARHIPADDRIEFDDVGDAYVMQANHWLNRLLFGRVGKSKAEYTYTDYMVAHQVLVGLWAHYGITEPLTAMQATQTRMLPS